MRRRVCTEMGGAALFYFRPMRTLSRDRVHHCPAAEDVHGGALKEGVSKTNTAEW